MDFFDIMKETNCKEVLFFEEPSVSLRAIVAINNTTLGPALSMCRMFDYKDEKEAVKSALDAASYNTYTSALLKKGLGGGSVVLLGDPTKIKSEMYFRALGIFLNNLNGKIVVTNGPGVTMDDLADVHRESEYVLGLSETHNGSGDTSVTTAKGVLLGIRAAVKEHMDLTSLENLQFVVQGVGDVGRHLVEMLMEEKARVTITDSNYDKIKVIQDSCAGTVVVKPSEVFDVKCDVFVSCAYENIINESNVDKVQAKIVTGSVSCMVSCSDIIDKLAERDVLVVPGFIINAGGIIQLSNEYEGYHNSRTEEDIKAIYFTTLDLIRQARAEKRPVSKIALERAKEYIHNVSAIKALK